MPRLPDKTWAITFLLSPAGCQGLRRPPTAPAGASALSHHQTQGCEMLPRLVEFIRGLCRRGSCILSIARHRAVVPPAEISSIRAPGRMPKGAQALAVFSPLALHCLPIAALLQGRAGTGPLTVRSTVRYAPAKHHAQAPRRESLVSMLKSSIAGAWLYRYSAFTVPHRPRRLTGKSPLWWHGYAFLFLRGNLDSQPRDIRRIDSLSDRLFG